MSQHLSEKQFAAAIVKGLAATESRHVAECSECAEELDAFQASVASFRSGFREYIDDRLARGRTHVPTAVTRRVQRPIGLWGLAAAMIALVVAVPFFQESIAERRWSAENPADASADALMRSIQAHLSRTVPGPMEPILIFVRNHELDSEQRGVR